MNRAALSTLAAAMLPINTFAAVAQEKTMTTSTGMELVWIPPGEFMMGSTPEEQAWAIENKCGKGWVKAEGIQQQRVAIKAGFWLGRTEVTVGQWKLFVVATGYVTDGEKAGASTSPNSGKGWGIVTGADWKDPGFGFKLTDNHPVSCISWNDAVAFCQWLTETQSKSGKLSAGMICRLPTEAEWEYACRAGTQTKFWWGDSPEGAERRCNTLGGADGAEFVLPVDHYGARGRNLFGLADMIGNVEEWCLDDFEGSSAHAECHKSGGTTGSHRGGAWSDYLATSRSAHRYGRPKNISHASFGFRVCCGAPDGGGQPSQNTAPLVAVVPPADMPPPPPVTAPTVAKATTPAPPPPPPLAPTPGPAKPQVATVPTSPPPTRAVGVKQTTFEISNISGSSQYAYVNNAWIRNVPCVQVTLRVNENVDKTPPNIKAYFYNKNRELVKELTRPTSVSFGNRESFMSPERFQPGKKYTVYFGVSESIQRGKDKWKHVVVLFGNRDCATAEVYPKDDINLFDYPEKELVAKGRGGR